MTRLITRPTRFGSIEARTPLVFAGQRIGVMGGTFNPPHDGHALVARTALKRLRLDQVWWLVTPGNPLKGNGQLPPLAARIEQTRKVAGDPHMRVTGFEAELGSAFTVDTLAFLKRRYPGVRFVWLMGADGLASFHRWRNWKEIAASIPIAVIDRPGFRLGAMASPAARSLRRFFLPEAQAALLARGRGPRWTFLSTKLSSLSSTELRAKSRSNPEK